MRLRNIKGAHDIIGASEYIVLNPNDYRGKMHELFGNDNDIEIEIGMGKGDFLINKAIKNPHINFIGIEKYASVLVKTVKKLENIKLNNLKIMNFDANMIDEVFDKEVVKIYLNFSDPWPKKKHANRRLTSPIFLNKYKNIFVSLLLEYQILRHKKALIYLYKITLLHRSMDLSYEMSHILSAIFSYMPQ